MTEIRSITALDHQFVSLTLKIPWSLKVFGRLTLTVATQHIFGHCMDMLNSLFSDRQLKTDSLDGSIFARAFADSQEYCLKLLLLPREYQYLQGSFF